MSGLFRLPISVRLGTLLLGIFLLGPERAQAQYIDPGSSSLLWQLLIAGFVGLGFTLRHYLLALWRRLFARKAKGPGVHTDDA